MDHTALFSQNRNYLFAVAYRMLGTVMDAEDILQEAFLRWRGVDIASVESARAYLTTIVTRLSLDFLASARVRREEYVGPWLPEPLLTDEGADVEKSVELAESISMAFLVLLESLSPVERAVFLLREVFAYDYPEVARIVEKSEENCRQIVRRAKERVAAGRPRFTPDREQGNRLLDRFVTACVQGDLAGLESVLAADITLWSDGGGKVNAARLPIHGADKVARFLLGVLRKAPADYAVRPAWINGAPGLIVYVAGHAASIYTFDGADDRIQAIRIVVNPDKLGHIPPLPKDADFAEKTD
jgi:RNA polymerase sigma-70 factor (ECF subfamily)